jgi:hypothetical protein
MSFIFSDFWFLSIVISIHDSYEFQVVVLQNEIFVSNVLCGFHSIVRLPQLNAVCQRHIYF